MFQLFTVLSYANSAVNPFLYAFTSSMFRQRFRSIYYGSRFSVNDYRRRSVQTAVRPNPFDASTIRRREVAKIQTEVKECKQLGVSPGKEVAAAISVMVELHELPKSAALRSVRKDTSPIHEVASTKSV
jgi:hypothetical protein